MNTKLITVAIAAILLSGCATVTRGPNQEVSFISEPSKAEVVVNKATKYDKATKTWTYETPYQSCVTPCVLRMKRAGNYQAVFTLPGFVTAMINIAPKPLSAAGVTAVAGNLIVGGLPGMIVDAATGSGLELTPDPVKATLVPDTTQATLSPQ
jgi:uncharacterized protein YceK